LRDFGDDVHLGRLARCDARVFGCELESDFKPRETSSPSVGALVVNASSSLGHHTISPRGSRAHQRPRAEAWRVPAFVAHGKDRPRHQGQG